jgi:hypothetical protein
MFRLGHAKDANHNCHQYWRQNMRRTRIILSSSHERIMNGGSVSPKVAVASMVIMRRVEVIGNIQTLGYETPIRLG